MQHYKNDLNSGRSFLSRYKKLYYILFLWESIRLIKIRDTDIMDLNSRKGEGFRIPVLKEKKQEDEKIVRGLCEGFPSYHSSFLLIPLPSYLNGPYI